MTQNQTMRKDHIFQSNRSSFNYIDWGGQGPLTHVAHATGLCAGAYTQMAEKLQKQLHVVGMDFRGHGKSTAPADPRRLKNWNVFYQDLEHFFEKFNRPVVAIGHSSGGTASLQVAARRPDLVSALVLIEPGIMPPSWRPWVFLAQKSGLSKHVPFVTRVMRRKNLWSSLEEARQDLYGKGPFKSWQDDFLSDYLEEGFKTDVEGTVKLACDTHWEGKCLATAPVDIWRYVRQVKIPTLVLYGKQSTTFLPAVVEKLRSNLPGVIIKGFENTGHYVPMERNNDTVNIILEFLKDVNINQGT